MDKRNIRTPAYVQLILDRNNEQLDNKSKVITCVDDNIFVELLASAISWEIKELDR